MNSNKNTSKDMSIVLPTLKNIAEAVMYAAEAGTLEQVLQRIAEVSKQVVNAKYAALGVPDGTGSLKYFKTAGISDEQMKLIGHLPVGRGLLGVIMHDRKTLRLPDMHQDSRSVGFPPNHPDMTSLLGVPIQVGPQLFGMLYLCDRADDQPFDEEDQWLVETLAGYAALAIAGVQLGEQQGRLVLLEERERIGMELHDGIIQSLYAIGMQLQLIRMSHQLPEDNLGDAIRSLDAVIEDIRRYILNLRVTNYEQQTMQEALQDVIARLHVSEHLAVEMDVPDRQPPFAPPVFEALCQIAYEAVSNVLRHAEASNLRVKVSYNDNLFQLVVEDDGKGFEIHQVDERNSLGLHNIQQRVRIHGGDIHIDTASQKGTRLTITLPVNTL
jgi:signal transduction histidine kinase